MYCWIIFRLKIVSLLTNKLPNKSVSRKTTAKQVCKYTKQTAKRVCKYTKQTAKRVCKSQNKLPNKSVSRKTNFLINIPYLQQISMTWIQNSFLRFND